jgi:hypothetical protein
MTIERFEYLPPGVILFSIVLTLKFWVVLTRVMPVLLIVCILPHQFSHLDPPLVVSIGFSILLHFSVQVLEGSGRLSSEVPI